MKALLGLCLLLSTSLYAVEPAEHKFFDKTARFTLAGSAALLATDAAITCHYLGRGQFHEAWLPVKSCAGIGVWMGSSFSAQAGLAYFLHRKGHHRLERMAEMFWASGSVAGISYTLTNRPRAEPAQIEIVPIRLNPPACIVGQTC